MQLDENVAFFRKEVTVQRVGWLLMLLVLLLGLLGLFGTGLLSNVEQRTALATVKYERFMRFENESELVFQTQNTAGSTIISFPQAYLRRFRIKRLTPEPESTLQQEGYIIYLFPGNGTAEVRFALSPREAGRAKGRIRVNDETFSLAHFVYP